MWKWHPENVRESTWDDLVESMSEAVKIADRHEVTLAFEPEINNVVNSVAQGAEAARRDRIAVAEGRDRPGEPAASRATCAG